jgi:hypothetical protein
MEAAVRSITILSFLFSLSACSAAKSAQLKPSVTVQIYDYARVSRGGLTQAERTISRLLTQAGLEVRVLRCWSAGEPYTSATCLKPPEDITLILRILPGRVPGRPSQLGVAVGTILGAVYYQRAIELAAERPASERVPAGQILGFGAAHEIAHLLLIPHSRGGIMRGNWSATDLQSMYAGNLNFTLEQGQAMRGEVGRRMQIAGANLPPRTPKE